MKKRPSPKAKGIKALAPETLRLLTGGSGGSDPGTIEMTEGASCDTCAVGTCRI